MYFCVLAAVFIVIAVYQTYLGQMLQIRWRRWLTDHYLAEWLGDRAYFHLELGRQRADNPDQRIANDLQLFVDGTLTLGLGLLSSVVALASFAAILWNLSGSLELSVSDAHVVIPGYMLWAALLYALAGTWLTHRIGGPLIALNFDQQRFEADFASRSYGCARTPSRSRCIAGSTPRKRRCAIALAPSSRTGGRS